MFTFSITQHRQGDTWSKHYTAYLAYEPSRSIAHKYCLWLIYPRLEVVVPDITSSTIIGASCGILICLFLIQPLGTSKLGSTFAPIVIIWLMFNLAFGIYVRRRFCDWTLELTLLESCSLWSHGTKSIQPLLRYRLVCTEQDRRMEVPWRYSPGFHRCRSIVRRSWRFFKTVSSQRGLEPCITANEFYSAIQLSWLCVAYPCLLIAVCLLVSGASRDHWLIHI